MQEATLRGVAAAARNGRRDGIPRHAPVNVFEPVALSMAFELDDLSGFVLRNVPQKDLNTLANESKIEAEKLKDGTDVEMTRVAELTRKLPAWVLRIVMRFQHFFHFTLNTSLRAFGLPDDRFGSVMISNFGPLGLETGLVPLSPYCRCPLIIGSEGELGKNFFLANLVA